MPITVETITAVQAAKVLNLEESHFGDVKAIEISPASLTKVIAAFANADGGELYVGIDETPDSWPAHDLRAGRSSSSAGTATAAIATAARPASLRLGAHRFAMPDVGISAAAMAATRTRSGSADIASVCGK